MATNMAAETLVMGRTAYTGEGQKIDCSGDIDRYKPGDHCVIWAGAPGIGRVVYRVTRLDEKGLWGVEVENTIRELDPSECV